MNLNATQSLSVPLLLHRVDDLSKVTPELIRQIIDGDPLLVVVPEALSPRVAREMAQRLLGAEWGSYSADTGAGQIGTLKAFETLFGCFGDRGCEDYFELAKTRMALLAKLLRPYQNPARTILEHLDEVWPKGADLLRIAGRACYVGLPRAFADGGAAEMHTDRADHDLPCDETSQIKAQIAFNWCLAQTMDPGSGSLALWPDVPDKASCDRLRRTDIPYALDESESKSPLVGYRPEPGDLYLFNAFRPHAVRPVGGGGVRVTISGFIDYCGDGSPLYLHS